MKFGRIACVVIGCVALMAGQAGTAGAAPDGTNPMSATVSRDFGCTVLDPDGGLALGFSSVSVETSSGRSVLTCQATDVSAPADGKALVRSGFACGTFAGVTTDSHLVVTPSGKAKLVCRI